MDIYFGGAYNGKLNYVKEKYKIGFYENIIKKLTNLFWELIESSS